MAQITNSKIINEKLWMETFPVIMTELDSCLFVKRLTALAIPTIIFMRKILPNSEFENKIFEGMTLRMLKQETVHPGTKRIKEWLAGAFDALEKKYLKNMVLEVRDACSELTLEVYTVTVGYNSENKTVKLSVLSGDSTKMVFRNAQETMKNIQFQTVRLLQMCYTVTKSCRNLPKEVTLSMKLSYHENTPVDYQPLGFKRYIPMMPVFATKTRCIEIGVINTKYHYLEVLSKTCFCDESLLPKARKTKKMNETESNSTADRDNGIHPKASFSGGNDDLFSHNEAGSAANGQINSGKSNKNDSHHTHDEFQSSRSDLVRCPCLCNRKTLVMYQCSGCSYWMHAECFGIALNGDWKQLSLFYCHMCHQSNKNYVCHDVFMTNLTSAFEQQKLAILRRLLGFCSRFEGKEIIFEKFEKISGLASQEPFLRDILKEMVKMGLIQQEKEYSYSVNKAKVIQNMSQYFHSKFLLNNSPAGNEKQMKQQDVAKSKAMRSRKRKVSFTDNNFLSADKSQTKK